mgnify:CR=1 FL=1
MHGFLKVWKFSSIWRPRKFKTLWKLASRRKSQKISQWLICAKKSKGILSLTFVSKAMVLILLLVRVIAQKGTVSIPKWVKTTMDRLMNSILTMIGKISLSKFLTSKCCSSTWDRWLSQFLTYFRRTNTITQKVEFRSLWQSFLHKLRCLFKLWVSQKLRTKKFRLELEWQVKFKTPFYLSLQKTSS